jgi:flavin reductase (DIM6/NTAB) family NADH-FMN oxidoreductase RutF
MTDDVPSPLLRHLTTPVCAITTSANGQRNGLIVNSAQRASLVPSIPRISFYISKINASHGLVMASGVFTVHLLRSDQWDLIAALGLRSMRDVPDKLAGFDIAGGTTGCPVLTDVRASFECRVVNVMDAGAATFILGDVVATRAGTPGDVMTSTHFREHAPADLRRRYEDGLSYAIELLKPLSGIEGASWQGPTSAP